MEQKLQNLVKLLFLLHINSPITSPHKVVYRLFEIVLPKVYPQQAFSLKLLLPSRYLHLADLYHEL